MNLIKLYRVDDAAVGAGDEEIVEGDLLDAMRGNCDFVLEVAVNSAIFTEACGIRGIDDLARGAVADKNRERSVIAQVKRYLSL